MTRAVRGMLPLATNCPGQPERQSREPNSEKQRGLRDAETQSATQVRARGSLDRSRLPGSRKQWMPVCGEGDELKSPGIGRRVGIESDLELAVPRTQHHADLSRRP